MAVGLGCVAKSKASLVLVVLLCCRSDVLSCSGDLESFLGGFLAGCRVCVNYALRKPMAQISVLSTQTVRFSRIVPYISCPHIAGLGVWDSAGEQLGHST